LAVICVSTAGWLSDFLVNWTPVSVQLSEAI